MRRTVLSAKAFEGKISNPNLSIKSRVMSSVLHWLHGMLGRDHALATTERTSVIVRHESRSSGRLVSVKTVLFRSLPLTFLILAGPAAPPVLSQAMPEISSRITVPWAGVLTSDVEDIFVTGSVDIQVESVSVRGALFTKLRSNISGTVGLGMKSRQDFVGVGGVMNTCSLPASSHAIGRFPVEIVSQQRLLVTGPVSPDYQQLRQAPLPVIYEITLSGDGRVLGAQVRMGKTRFRDPANK